MKFSFTLFDTIKFLLDYFLALILSPIILLLFIVVSIGIRLDSVGPVFFVQERLGRKGKVFRMYKFRTMVVDADKKQQELMGHNEADGFLFKMKDDPRITRLGRILRHTGLDELPQVINVLKREMSFVGPRPLPLTDVREEQLASDPTLLSAWQKRQEVLPGITGWWQMKATNKMSFTEMVALDLHYIKSRSLSLDLSIIFLTIFSILKGLRYTLRRIFWGRMV